MSTSTSTNAAPERMWSVSEVAAFLNCSKQWVYKHAELGNLRCVRLGALLRFDPADVRRYVEEQKHGGATAARVLPFRPGG